MRRHYGQQSVDKAGNVYTGQTRGRLLLALLLFASPLLQAQEYSHDGNRWYEVEVSIFTNDYPRGEHAEIAVAENFSAAYLPRVQQLHSRTASLAVDFPGDRIQAGLSPEPRFPDAAVPVPLNPELVSPVPPDPPRPLFSPARPESFHVMDVEHDPFIDLEGEPVQFTAMNRDIDNSPQHRLLWHKVWRQPMQGLAQAPAVFIGGGDIVGRHSELEGSLRLSDNSGRVMLDISAWLARFVSQQPFVVSGPLVPEEVWELPARPFPVTAEQDLEQDIGRPDTSGVLQTETGGQPARSIEEVWQLELSRELNADQLYYLDNPAIGVLIQIRPYVLPARLTSDGGEDF